jgi:hypothetical protein
LVIEYSSGTKDSKIKVEEESDTGYVASLPPFSKKPKMPILSNEEAPMRTAFSKAILNVTDPKALAKVTVLNLSST